MRVLEDIEFAYACLIRVTIRAKREKIVLAVLRLWNILLVWANGGLRVTQYGACVTLSPCDSTRGLGVPGSENGFLERSMAANHTSCH
jgi:hypothetical protein